MNESQASSAEMAIEILWQGWRRVFTPLSREVRVGRGPDCDLSLPDPQVSRTHCVLRSDATGSWTVEDSGSSAGTTINDRPLQRPTTWQLGERLQVGSTNLVLRPAWVAKVRAAKASDLHLEPLIDGIGSIEDGEGLEGVMAALVDRALELLDGDRGAVLMAVDAGLEIVAARDRSQRDLPVTADLIQSLPRESMRSGQSVLLDDLDLQPRDTTMLRSVFEQNLGSVVCVPLPGDPQPIGVLYVDSHRGRSKIDEVELATLELLATRGALALVRAGRREDERRANEQERRALATENQRLKQGLEPRKPIAEDGRTATLLLQLERVATTDASVVLLGETGTGKGLLMRHLHNRSLRSAGPLVVVDCGALPDSLVEAELFGHEKGAFTHAHHSRPGRFREAHGGTIFLDEIGDLPLDVQSRLLRVLQDGVVRPIGSERDAAVDVRVVCATHRNLQEMVQAGTFREDLFYRLSVLTFDVPPLRDRGEDVLLIARHLLRQMGGSSEDSTGSPLRFSRGAERALLDHTWPGNVRELENRVQRAVLMRSGPWIVRQDLLLGPATEPEPTPGAHLPTYADARATAHRSFEKSYLDELLTRTEGNVSDAARKAGVSRAWIHKLLKEHQIDSADFRPGVSSR